jgi:hypothetical protein
MEQKKYLGTKIKSSGTINFWKIIFRNKWNKNENNKEQNI